MKSGNIGVNQRDAVSADDLLQRRADGVDEPRFLSESLPSECWRNGVVVKFTDQDARALRCRFAERNVAIAIADEFIFERLIIFDHAIVDQRELAAGVEMRMRILVGDFAVRRPARVADAEKFRLAALPPSTSTSSAMRPAHLRVSTWLPFDNRDAGGVVAAIFETAQPVEQDGSRLRASDVANNPAHDSDSERDTNGPDKQDEATC